MTNERKREIEGKLDVIVAQLKEIVEEMHYGVSIMVLPRNTKSTVCIYIHECGGRNGMLPVHGSFIGVLDKEFEYDEEDEEEC